jgi:hypothetical protein
MLVKNALYGETTPLETYFKPGQGITSEEIVDFIRSSM